MQPGSLQRGLLTRVLCDCLATSAVLTASKSLIPMGLRDAVKNVLNLGSNTEDGHATVVKDVRYIEG